MDADQDRRPRLRKRRKDLLLATTTVRSMFAPRYYNHAYLWADVEGLIANSTGSNRNTVGCYVPNTWLEHYRRGNLEVKPKLGELHFVRNRWNEKVICHEVVHAIMHRLRVLVPYFPEALYQEKIPAPGYRGAENCEEIICHEAGHWQGKLHTWLWKVNPYGEHRGNVAP